MLGEGLTTRYDFSGETSSDALVRRISGRRLDDGRDVILFVFEEAAGVGQAQGEKAVQTAGALKSLKLASVLPCIEAGRDDDGHVYMVFEAPSLPSLKSAIRERGGLAPAQALDVLHAVAATLARTSSASIHHQDLSSSTIYTNVLDGGPLRVQIEGFGLAGILPSYNPARKTAPYFGNAEYMAPEVCSGRPGTPSSDLYSLGILLYEMVSGKPPFVSAGASTTIKRQVYEKPLPLHLVKPGLQQLDRFEGLVMSLLAKDPTGRPASASDVVDAIKALQNEVFFDISLAVESERPDYPGIVSTFVEALPQPVQVSGAPGETMAFEGLSEAVARMIESQAPASADVSTEAPAGASVAAPAESSDESAVEGAKTEAFDASFIASVVEQAAAGGDIGQAIADLKAGAEQVSEVAAAEPEAPVAEQPAQAPVAEAAAPEPAKPARQPKPEKPRKEKKTKQVPVQAPAPVPAKKPAKQVESVRRQPAGKGKKGSVVVVVVILALAVLLAIGAAFWWKNRAAGPGTPGSGTVATEQTPPAPNPAEVARAKAFDLVTSGREMLSRGDVDGAAAAVKQALLLDAGLPAAIRLQADVEAKQAEMAKPAPAPAPAPAPEAAPAVDMTKLERQPRADLSPVPAIKPASPVAVEPIRPKRVVTTPPTRVKPTVTKPAPAPAPEPAPAPVDPKVEANSLRAKARTAYKSGDCKTAVSLLNKVKELGQSNSLDAEVLKKCATQGE